MDRSVAMPRRAWVEIRDQDGTLILQLPATISGGAIQAEIPAFPPNMRGTVEVHTEPEEGLADTDLRELPTTPQLLRYDIG